MAETKEYFKREYVQRFQLRELVEEWLDRVGNERPEDPYQFLIAAAEEQRITGGGVVTCPNTWCEMTMPAAQLATHRETCDNSSNWAKCVRCNKRVEASKLTQHRMLCQMERCLYCGEMVLPRMVALCPYRLQLEAERDAQAQAFRRHRREAAAADGREDTALADSNRSAPADGASSIDIPQGSTEIPPGGQVSPSVLPAALDLRHVLRRGASAASTREMRDQLQTSFKLSVPPAHQRIIDQLAEPMVKRLTIMQRLWRRRMVQQQMRTVVFGRVWDSLEASQEAASTQETLTASRRADETFRRLSLVRQQEEQLEKSQPSMHDSATAAGGCGDDAVDGATSPCATATSGPSRRAGSTTATTDGENTAGEEITVSVEDVLNDAAALEEEAADPDPIVVRDEPDSSGAYMHVVDMEALTRHSVERRRLPACTVVRIIRAATRILQQQPVLVHVRIPTDGSVGVIGDLHGQMKDLLHVLHLLGGVPSARHHFLFNGDFVDRGPFGCEVIVHIFGLLCTYPQYVYLNRGNHEDYRTNMEYGFMAELFGKYGSSAAQIHDALLQSYTAMPIMTIVDRRIAVVHGGVPRDPCTLDEIAALQRVRDIPVVEQHNHEERLLTDLLWNDPVVKFRSRQLGERHQGDGWRTSKRGCGAEYLASVTERFLRDNNLSLVIRSHDVTFSGFELLHNGMCVTVFSASNYGGVSGNRGAVAVLTKDTRRPVFHTWFVKHDYREVLLGVNPNRKTMARSANATRSSSSGGKGGKSAGMPKKGLRRVDNGSNTGDEEGDRDGILDAATECEAQENAMAFNDEFIQAFYGLCPDANGDDFYDDDDDDDDSDGSGSDNDGGEAENDENNGDGGSGSGSGSGGGADKETKSGSPNEGAQRQRKRASRTSARRRSRHRRSTQRDEPQIMGDTAIMTQLRTLQTIRELVFLNRYRLLTLFCHSDEGGTGIIDKMLWCNAMREVINAELPWYYLSQFLIPRLEVDGVPSVEYVRFLRHYDAAFAPRYRPGWIRAVIRRIFGTLDLPEDIEKAFCDDPASYRRGQPLQRSPGLLQQTCSGRLSREGERAAGCALPLPTDTTARHTSVTPLLLPFGSPPNEVELGLLPTPPLQGVEDKDWWRTVVFDFKTFVMRIRSVSPSESAALDDTEVYCLFCYFDVHERGHIVLGEFIDQLNAFFESDRLEDEEPELLLSGELDFTQAKTTVGVFSGSPPVQQNEEATARATAPGNDSDSGVPHTPECTTQSTAIDPCASADVVVPSATSPAASTSSDVSDNNAPPHSLSSAGRGGNLAMMLRPSKTAGSGSLLKATATATGPTSANVGRASEVESLDSDGDVSTPAEEGNMKRGGSGDGLTVQAETTTSTAATRTGTLPVNVTFNDDSHVYEDGDAQGDRGAGDGEAHSARPSSKGRLVRGGALDSARGATGGLLQPQLGSAPRGSGFGSGDAALALPTSTSATGGKATTTAISVPGSHFGSEMGDSRSLSLTSAAGAKEDPVWLFPCLLRLQQLLLTGSSNVRLRLIFNALNQSRDGKLSASEFASLISFSNRQMERPLTEEQGIYVFHCIREFALTALQQATRKHCAAPSRSEATSGWKRTSSSKASGKTPSLHSAGSEPGSGHHHHHRNTSGVQATSPSNRSTSLLASMPSFTSYHLRLRDERAAGKEYILVSEFVSFFGVAACPESTASFGNGLCGGVAAVGGHPTQGSIATRHSSRGGDSVVLSPCGVSARTMDQSTLSVHHPGLIVVSGANPYLPPPKNSSATSARCSPNATTTNAAQCRSASSTLPDWDVPLAGAGVGRRQRSSTVSSLSSSTTVGNRALEMLSAACAADGDGPPLATGPLSRHGSFSPRHRRRTVAAPPCFDTVAVLQQLTSQYGAGATLEQVLSALRGPRASAHESPAVIPTSAAFPPRQRNSESRVSHSLPSDSARLFTSDPLTSSKRESHMTKSRQSPRTSVGVADKVDANPPPPASPFTLGSITHPTVSTNTAHTASTVFSPGARHTIFMVNGVMGGLTSSPGSEALMAQVSALTRSSGSVVLPDGSSLVVATGGVGGLPGVPPADRPYRLNQPLERRMTAMSPFDMGLRVGGLLPPAIALGELGGQIKKLSGAGESPWQGLFFPGAGTARATSVCATEESGAAATITTVPSDTGGNGDGDGVSGGGGREAGEAKGNGDSRDACPRHRTNSTTRENVGERCEQAAVASRVHGAEAWDESKTEPTSGAATEAAAETRSTAEASSNTHSTNTVTHAPVGGDATASAPLHASSAPPRQRPLSDRGELRNMTAHHTPSPPPLSSEPHLQPLRTTGVSSGKTSPRSPPFPHAHAHAAGGVEVMRIPAVPRSSQRSRVPSLTAAALCLAPSGGTHSGSSRANPSTLSKSSETSVHSRLTTRPTATAPSLPPMTALHAPAVGEDMSATQLPLKETGGAAITRTVRSPPGAEAEKSETAATGSHAHMKVKRSDGGLAAAAVTKRVFDDERHPAAAAAAASSIAVTTTSQSTADAIGVTEGRSFLAEAASCSSSSSSPVGATSGGGGVPEEVIAGSGTASSVAPTPPLTLPSPSLRRQGNLPQNGQSRNGKRTSSHNTDAAGHPASVGEAEGHTKNAAKRNSITAATGGDGLHAGPPFSPRRRRHPAWQVHDGDGSSHPHHNRCTSQDSSRDTSRSPPSSPPRSHPNQHHYRTSPPLNPSRKPPPVPPPSSSSPAPHSYSSRTTPRGQNDSSHASSARPLMLTGLSVGGSSATSASTRCSSKSEDEAIHGRSSSRSSSEQRSWSSSVPAVQKTKAGGSRGTTAHRPPSLGLRVPRMRLEKSSAASALPRLAADQTGPVPTQLDGAAHSAPRPPRA